MQHEDEIEETIRELLYEHLDTETEVKATHWLTKRSAAYEVLSEMGIVDGIDVILAGKKLKKS